MGGWGLFMALWIMEMVIKRLSACLSLLIWVHEDCQYACHCWFECWRLSACLSLLIWVLKTVSMPVTVDLRAEDCQYACCYWFERWRLSVCLSLLIWALKTVSMPVCLSLLIWVLKTASMPVAVDLSAEDCQYSCHCWFERWRLSVCLSLLI